MNTLRVSVPLIVAYLCGYWVGATDLWWAALVAGAVMFVVAFVVAQERARAS
jgi:L-lactate permease